MLARAAISLLLLGLLGACAPGFDAPSPTGPTPDLGAALPADRVPGRADGLAAAAGITPRLGIVVIDVQQGFIEGAANKNITEIVDGTRSIFDWASAQKTPFLITYEHSSTQSGYTLPAQLKAALPAGAKEFVKTTFAATGQPAFAATVKQLELTHFIVAGAETDVCVLQTVLGLRAMGLAVLLLEDTLFTSEPNTGPALRRMRQAGVLMTQRAQVPGYLAQPAAVPAAPTAPVPIVKPLGIAVVLNDFDDAALASAIDPKKNAKQARLRELLLISEWFDLPVYSTTGTLPSTLKSLIPKTPIRPLAELHKNAQRTQVVVAGADQGLPALVATLRASHEVFLMADGLLMAAGSNQPTMLEGLYQGGSVPITYKSLYYEITQSIDPAQWAAQAWRDRYQEYFDKTNAPEDLPPLL